MRHNVVPSLVLLLIGLVCVPATPAGSPISGLRQLGSGGNGLGGTVDFVARIDDQTLLTDDGTVYDIRDPSAPRPLGSTGWPGMDLALAGGVGYLAGRNNGLVILDLKDLTRPSRLGGFRISGDARAIELEGALAHVAAGDAGLRIFDVSTPARIDQVGVYPSSLLDSLMARDLRVQGGLAYVAAGTDTLEILRVGTPDRILRAGGLKTGLDAEFMDWMGSQILLAGVTGGLQLIDVADPSKPVLMGRWTGVPGSPLVCHGIRVMGPLCYLAAADAGILIVDWSDPTQPRLAGSFQTRDPVLGVTVIGSRVLASLGRSGFAVFEPVSNAVPPPRITAQPEGKVLNLGTSTQLEVRVEPAEGASFQWFFDRNPIPGATGAILTFAAVEKAHDGVYTVQVSNESGSVVSEPATLKVVYPPTIHTQPTDEIRVEGGVLRLFVGAAANSDLQYQWYRNGEALAGASADALELNPLTPQHAGTYSVRVSNPAGSVLSTNAVVAVRARIHLRQVGRWPAVPDGEYARRLRVVGSHVFLAHGSSGLRVIDITDPASPRLVGQYEGNGYAYGLHVSGNRVYLANGSVGGLVVLDVSNPAQPVRLGQFATGAPVTDVRVVGSLAYLASGAKGLAIIDVSQPAAMKRVGTIDDSYGATSLEVTGDWVFLADGTGGMLVVYAGDPAKPVPVAQYAKPDFGEYSVRDVRVVGSLAFVTCTYEGLWIADVSDPLHPVTIGFAPGYSLGVHVQGNHAYVGGYDTGLRVLDVTTPRQTRDVGFFETPGEVNDVDTAGSLVFVADGKNGLLILESSQTPTPTPTRLEIVRRSNPAALRVRCPGSQRVVLQRSSDLRVWTAIQTNLPPAGASESEFIIAPAPTSPAEGFYRAAW